KGIGGGVPLGALLATEAASCFEHGDQGGTFNGNPLMCAAGLAVLGQVGKPEFLGSVVDTGRYLESELQGYPRGMVSARFAAAGCCWRSTPVIRSWPRSSPRRLRTACCSTHRGPMQ